LFFFIAIQEAIVNAIEIIAKKKSVENIFFMFLPNANLHDYRTPHKD